MPRERKFIISCFWPNCPWSMTKTRYHHALVIIFTKKLSSTHSKRKCHHSSLLSRLQLILCKTTSTNENVDYIAVGALLNISEAPATPSTWSLEQTLVPNFQIASNPQKSGYPFFTVTTVYLNGQLLHNTEQPQKKDATKMRARPYPQNEDVDSIASNAGLKNLSLHHCSNIL